MRGKRLRFAFAFVAAALVVAVPAALAGSDVDAIEGDAAAWTPLSLSNEPVTVMVEVAGDPVAVVQAKAGRKLGAAEKARVKGELAARQDALKPALQRLGASVLGDYQVAYSGIKIQVPRKSVAAIEGLKDVVAVRDIQLMEPDHANGVPLIRAPEVWNGAAGLRGENIKIAILDTGIDYTHATFGGPGTTAAFNAANEASTLPAPPTMFGPAAPKVKGGIDLVGDDYNASGTPEQQVPQPDPNPLDCNGHGTHVAGTAAGFGVNSDGTTYTGSYDPTTFTANSFRIGPGVAPRADLYAVRVFGCAGSTAVTVDAIEWAVDNDMDVINMSLGSAFGSADDPSAVASTNAAAAGVIVVASAGNSGSAQYITGSPATGAGAISVAANDATRGFPGADLALPSGTIQAINANGAEFSTMDLEVKVLRDPAQPGGVALGCDPAEYVGVAGKLVVTQRGVCARVARAIFGEMAGAAAVVMINNSTALPPFEGPITSNPDDGTPFTVTIPFLGVRGLVTTATSDGAKLVAADGQTIAVSPATLENTNYTGFASFTSGGPRRNDSWLKPDITAPGVSVLSAGVGTGNGILIISGTSMAAPHVAGVAALTRQAHPSWMVEDIKAAIVNTGNPAGVLNFRISRGGTGLVDAPGSTRTSVVAIGDPMTATLNFGFEEIRNDYSKTKTITVRNHGSSPATFSVSVTDAQGSPHSVSVGSDTVTVPAGGQATLPVTLSVPAATIGSAAAFREVAGFVQLTPAAGSNNGIALRVPYYLVPRALSDVKATLKGQPNRGNRFTTEAIVSNSPGAAVAGSADFYTWGLDDKKDQTVASNDLRAAGVQSFAFPSAADPNRRLLVFAVNTYDRWSNASEIEFDVLLDVDNDGTWDYVVVGADQGLLQTGSFSGNMVTAIFSTRSPGGTLVFNATAPHDSSTILLPMHTAHLCRANEPCLNAANPRFTYTVQSFALRFGSTTDVFDETAKYNAWTPTITDGQFVAAAELPPGASKAVPVAINTAEAARTPAKGLMVVTHDDKNGNEEAELLRIPAAG